MTAISQHEHGAAARESEMTRTRQHRQRRGGGGTARVVVAGAGFGGLAAARVVVAGAGFGGLVADLRSITLPALFGDLDPARVHIRLLDRGPALLAPFHPRLREYTRRELAARGVEVRLGTAITEIIPDHVLLADGTALASDITVWAAGVAAPDAAAGWGLPQAGGGRIRTGPDLRVTGQERIFAVGDIALIDGEPLPQLAQPALQMGRHAAGQVRRLERGRPAIPFRYRDKGIMATVGYRSAVVQLPGHVRSRGTPAWLAWLALHLITMLGGRNRISALVNLSWRYLSWRRGGGLIVGEGMTGPGPAERPARPAGGGAPARAYAHVAGVGVDAPAGR